MLRTLLLNLHRYILKLLGITLCVVLFGCATPYASQSTPQQFIQHMALKHQFDPQQLTELFSEVKPDKRIIKLMKKPHEALPWYKYRPIFLTPQNAEEGALFWQQHATTLVKAEQRYGVPPQIIVGILGVETRYGRRQGGYSALRSLSTLAFDYPSRAKYFSDELEQFLLLTRELPIDPRLVQSSYAGALGQPQFMPSSYRQYAVAYESQQRGDLFTNSDDAIMSIAHYLKEKGWRRDVSIAQFIGMHSTGDSSAIPASAKIYILQDKVGSEYWLGYHNFSVIMRYNTSSLYAMAVYQLGEQIKIHYRKLPQA